MRVVRWSRRNRSSSASGSVARRSIWSSRESCRCSSDWLRRARLRNTSLRPLPQPGLFHRGPDGGLPDQVERLSHPADLVTADPQRLAASAFTSTFSPRLSLAHHVRQLVLGELEGVALQAAQAADDAARDQDGHRW